MERTGVGVTSEIGRLRAVVCHTPGAELLAVTPSTRADFLYDDIIDLAMAQREHGAFKAVLSRFAGVYEVRDLLETIADQPEVRSFLIERVMDVARSEPLARALMAMPAPELVSLFLHGRASEAGPLEAVLQRASYDLPPLPNLFFTRDAAMVVGTRVIVGSMRYTVRWTEEILMKALFKYHPLLANDGFLYDGSEERRAAHTIEGGDVHVLRRDLVLIGISERSSPAALDTLAEHMMREQGIRDLLVVVLPTARAMIHLDMVFTMVDREHCVVYPPSFVGPTRHPVLHYRAGSAGMREMPNLFAALRELDLPVEPVFCGGDDPITQEREQWTSGCNFVCVRPGLLLGYSRNERTSAELAQAGYRVVRAADFLAGTATVGDNDRAVITFEGSELVRGGGGGRCMTLPVRRDEPW